MKKIVQLVSLIFLLQTISTAQINTPGSVNSIPPGYYNTATGKICAALKTALFNITSSGTSVLTYTPGVWDAFGSTDLRRNDANTADIIWDIYSDNPTGPETFTYTLGSSQCNSILMPTAEGNCYNREHSFPQAWFGNGAYPMFSDLHHIFPTDGWSNAKHDNNPYAEVKLSSPTPSYISSNGSKLGSCSFTGFTGTVFEPNDAYKGDIARAYFYMVTRYEDNMTIWNSNANAGNVLNGSSYPSLKDWYIKLLYKWHLQDPVSAKEIARNDAIYALQGNRNPFVDHPEYVELIWRCTGLLPVTLIDFKATKTTNAISLCWAATRETNFSKYEIERSTNGNQFNKIGTVAAQNLGNYTAIDNNLPDAKTVFYRLKMVDIDGRFTYSKVVAVRLFSAAGLLLFPNPTSNEVTVKMQQAFTTNSQVKIMDVAGRMIMNKIMLAGQTITSFNVQSLAVGKYFISIQSNESVLQESFIKVK